MAGSERGIYFVDRELRFVTVNPVALRRWGKSAREVLNHTVAEVFPNALGGEVHLAMVNALRTFQPARFKSRSLVVDGDVEVEIYPVNNGLQVVLSYPDGERRSW